MTESTARLAGLQIGDTALVTGPDKTAYLLDICGILSDTPKLLARDGYGIMMTPDGTQSCFTAEDVGRSLCVKFSLRSDFQKSIGEITSLYGLKKENVLQNSYLLATYGQNDDASFQELYIIAVILFILVLCAGVLMITGSFACMVSERMQFYGLLRCLGASPLQVKRYVRMESLLYCRTAVPAGVLSGMAASWILCGILKAAAPTYFAAMPQFSVSFPGIVAGIVMGFMAVCLAARAPAKKAASVSPVSAVSSSLDEGIALKRKKKIRMFGRRIELVLGLHHAVSRKKTYVLVTLSMAFSIILFLSFTPMVDLMHQALRPLKPWSPDVTISDADEAFTKRIPAETAEKIAALPAVEKAYGRMYLSGITGE